MTLAGGGTAEEALAALAVNAIPAVLTSDPGSTPWRTCR